jgi:hypothetical protein
MHKSARTKRTESHDREGLAGLAPEPNPPDVGGTRRSIKNMTKEKAKNLSEQEREAYALVGRHGGRATFKNKGAKHMSSIGRIGAAKRWGKRSPKEKQK